MEFHIIEVFTKENAKGTGRRLEIGHQFVVQSLVHPFEQQFCHQFVVQVQNW